MNQILIGVPSLRELLKRKPRAILNIRNSSEEDVPFTKEATVEAKKYASKKSKGVYVHIWKNVWKVCC